MINFYFRGMQEKRDLKDLVGFLASQDLGYPRYDEWIQRTEHDLDSGYKQTVLAFSERRLVGDLIFQTHKSLSSFLELKNLRINSEFRFRDFARFMLRQVEVENQEKYDAIICDTRTDQKGTIEFMGSCGYIPFIAAPLYDSNVPDTILIKLLNPEKRELLISKVKTGLYRKLK